MLKQVARHEETIRRSVLLVLLYLIAPLQAILPIVDPDVWHRSTGQWITVPAKDSFSSYGMGKTWIAYS